MTNPILARYKELIIITRKSLVSAQELQELEDLESQLEFQYKILEKRTTISPCNCKHWEWEHMMFDADKKRMCRNCNCRNFEPTLESKLAKADERLTPLGIKWVQCLKCRKDYVEFYPKQQCTCGSYEYEEADALLTDLLDDYRKLKQIKEYFAKCDITENDIDAINIMAILNEESK